MESGWREPTGWVQDVIRSEKITPSLPPGNITLAAIGTLAGARLVGGPLLATFNEADLDVEEVTAFDGPDQLIDDPTWDMALVLSPFKRHIVKLCDALSPRAARVGAVDTVVRSGTQIVGYNVNSFAIQRALHALSLLPDNEQEHALVLGTGAMAAAALVAISTINSSADAGVLGRSHDHAADMVSEISAGRVLESAKGFGATLVVHATTVGEQDDSQVLEVDIGDVFRPGVRFLDSNNRFSRLQRTAVKAGALVLGGRYLRDANNLLRIALVSARGE